MVVGLLTLAGTAAAQHTRAGPWNGAAYAAPIVEPNTARSYILANDGGRIYDHYLTELMFTNPATRFTAYNHAIFTIEACHSGGFIGDLGAIDGREGNLNVAANRRSGIVVNTSVEYGQCGGASFFDPGTAGAGYNDAFSHFPHDWQDRIVNNGAGDVQMESAFRGASQATVARGNGQVPQYYAESALANTFTLRSLLPGTHDYAYLFAVKEANANQGWEFFRDIERQRNILINNYGWDDQHIIVMYGAGPGDTLPDNATAVPAWVDYAATEQGLIQGLLATRQNVGSFSKVHWFSTSHGDSTMIPTPGTLSLLAASLLVGARRRRR